MIEQLSFSKLKFENEHPPFRNWIRSNYYDLVEAINYVLRKKQEKIKINELNTSELIFYDFNKRTISEMPLCESIRLLNYLPSGYSFCEGSVQIKRYSPPKHCLYHQFMKNENGQIICLFPGQFIKLEDDALKPGDRLAIIKSEAPELITNFSNGLALLHGSIYDIDKKLGLKYISSTINI